METKSLQEKGGDFEHKEEQEAISEMKIADNLLADSTEKLEKAISSSSKVNSQGAKVACLMIETAKSNQQKEKEKLTAVTEKQRKVNTKNKRLLQKALPEITIAPASKKKKK